MIEFASGKLSRADVPKTDVFRTQLSNVAIGPKEWEHTDSVPSKRFSELQDEFFETSKRLRLTQKPEEKLELLNELQRIVKESKRP